MVQWCWERLLLLMRVLGPGVSLRTERDWPPLVQWDLLVHHLLGVLLGAGRGPTSGAVHQLLWQPWQRQSL
jgi:hypothetical protein